MTRAFQIRRPDTAFATAPIKGARRPRQKDDKHLDFIRGLPCCVCGSRKGVEAAHLRMASRIHGKAETGAGVKPDDVWVTPLCAEHHRTGKDAQHNIGEEAFWAKHGIDPFALCLSLMIATGDQDRAEAIIQTVRAAA